MKLLLPIAGNAPRGAGHGLARRVRARRRQVFRTVDHRLRPKIVKPRLTRFEARDNGVLRMSKMLSSVLARRAVATPDVTARRAATKVQPPAAAREALDASRPTGLRAGNDFFAVLCHLIRPGHKPYSSTEVRAIHVPSYRAATSQRRRARGDENRSDGKCFAGFDRRKRRWPTGRSRSTIRQSRVSLRRASARASRWTRRYRPGDSAISVWVAR